MSTRIAGAIALLVLIPLSACQSPPPSARWQDDLPTPAAVLEGLRDFYARTARPDGSFANGIDPSYLGMSDSAYSDFAAVTYAVTVHKTFGWKLPYEEKTIEFILARQRPTGEFFNVAGTISPDSPEGKVYNTTQALVALKALGVKPKFDPLPVFEEILRADYKTLPAYSTSFFPLAYLCYDKAIPDKADRGIRALMIQDETGYMNNHIAATYHASHYYRLVGEPTPKSEEMIYRTLRDQNADGSWLLNMPSRDRHATFDAVFVLHQEGGDRADCAAAIRQAAEWALSCRNADGGFGHYPGSTSDADAIYFQVGTLVMAGYLKPADPLPRDPHLLSWGHAMPVRENDPARCAERPFAALFSNPHPGTAPELWSLRCGKWVGAVAFSSDGRSLLLGSDGAGVALRDARDGSHRATMESSYERATTVAISKDRKTIATGLLGGELILHDEDGTVRHIIKTPGGVMSVAFTPDDRSVIAANVNGRICLWPIRPVPSEAGMLTRSDPPAATLTGHRSWVNSIAVMPGGKLLSGSSDGTVRIWSLATNTCEKTIEATSAEVRSVACSADGKWIAAGMRYGHVKVWDAATLEERYAMKCPEGDAWSVAFTPDSQVLVTGSGDWNRGGHVKLWSLADGKETRTFHHTGEVLSVAVSPDGTLLAAGGGDGRVRVWKVK